jgi:hypothetical protein
MFVKGGTIKSKDKCPAILSKGFCMDRLFEIEKGVSGPDMSNIKRIKAEDYYWLRDAVAGFRVLFNHPAITHNNDCDCESCKDFALAIRDARKRGWIASKD